MTVEKLIEVLNDPAMITTKFEGYTINRIGSGFEVCNGVHLIDSAETVQEVLDIIFMNAIA